MRILEVVDTLDSGGMEQQIIALTKRLPTERFAFEFCCLRHPGVLASKLPPHIPCHALGKPEGFRWQAVNALDRLIRTGEFDLVHSHNLGPLIYSALATGGGLRAPILHGEHAQLNQAEFSLKRTWQRRVLYKACRAVHTVSVGQRDELLRHSLRHSRLLALQNGVDTDRFQPTQSTAERALFRAKAGIPEQSFVFGIVARFGAYKRHVALLQAFIPIAKQHPKAVLVMVGNGGPEQERVMALAQSAPCSAQILLAGFQPDPAPWYRAFDALVVPSTNEGLSNVSLEAMASALPVLTNDICGAKELLEEGDGGWIRDLSTPTLLSTEMLRILEMPSADLAAVGKAGRQRVIRHFSWTAMAEAYTDCFHQCVHRQ